MILDQTLPASRLRRPVLGYVNGLPVTRYIDGLFIDLSAEADYRRYCQLEGCHREVSDEVIPEKRRLWQWLRRQIYRLRSAYRLWRGIETYLGRKTELRVRKLPREFRALQFPRSRDARVVFEDFAKRFFFAPSPNGFYSLRPIREIIETGSDRYELAFVLECLFVWNGIDCEIEAYEGDEKGDFGRGDIEYFLLYVPAVDQYFDPTLRLTERQRSGWDPRDFNMSKEPGQPWDRKQLPITRGNPPNSIASNTLRRRWSIF
jgi:hypothetical protein